MSRHRALILLGGAVIAFNVVLYLVDPSMHSRHGPTILGFEFAGSQANAARMMSEWGHKGRAAARLSLWLDFGYLLSYGAFFTLAGFATRDIATARGWRRLAVLGSVVPLFATGAALFDASENVALLLTLGGHGGSFAPSFATVCASIKFALIGIAILYVLWGLAHRLAAQQRPPVAQ